MSITVDTSIAELKLTTQAPKNLADEGITTVGQLLAYKRSAVTKIRGMGEARMADLDRALQLRGLWYGKPIPVHAQYNTCSDCPVCPDCGNPRATSARNVAVGLDGRAAHIGHRVGPVCEGCDTHHRQLVAASVAA
jgi:hypothetical protein